MEFGVRKRVFSVLRLRRHPRMVIVQVNVRLGPVRHTRKCNVLVKRHIRNGAKTRKLASSFQNHQFVLRHILLPAREHRTENPGINCEGLHPSHYHSDFLSAPFHRASQEFPIQISLQLCLMSLSFQLEDWPIRQTDPIEPGLATYFSGIG